MIIFDLDGTLWDSSESVAEYGFGHIEDPIARLYSFDELEDIVKELKC